VTSSRSDRSGTRRDVIVLLASALAFRVLFQIAYAPFWTGDGPSYAVWWLVVKNRMWQFYDGFRPPIYPLLLGLVQWLSGSPASRRLSPNAGELVVSFQQLAGVSAAVLLYLALRNLDVRRRLSFWSAFFYALLAPVCLAEMMILPLALTSYLVIAALWLFTVSLRRTGSGPSGRGFAAVSGLTFALAALTRAEILAFLIVFAGTGLAASFIYRRHPHFTGLRSSALTASAFAAPLIFGLMCFNALMIGQFTFTTGKPLNATCTVYNLFDRVEPSDRVFGEIMLKYYRGPARIDLVNDALPELLRHSTEMPMERRGPLSAAADLYAYAGQVSHRLQRSYPRLYLSNATQSFGRTFDFSQGSNLPSEHVRDPESLEGQSILENDVASRLTEQIRWAEAPIMLAIYCLMLLCLPAALLGACTKRFHVTVRHAVVFAVALSTFATLLAFGFFHTYFPHYGLVFFGCIVLCGAAIIDSIVSLVEGRKASVK